MVETTQQTQGEDVSMEQMDDQDLIGILVDEQSLIGEAEAVVADIKRIRQQDYQKYGGVGGDQGKTMGSDTAGPDCGFSVQGSSVLIRK
jgi:hypothetical protein